MSASPPPGPPPGPPVLHILQIVPAQGSSSGASAGTSAPSNLSEVANSLAAALLQCATKQDGKSDQKLKNFDLKCYQDAVKTVLSSVIRSLRARKKNPEESLLDFEEKLIGAVNSLEPNVQSACIKKLNKALKALQDKPKQDKPNSEQLPQQKKPAATGKRQVSFAPLRAPVAGGPFAGGPFAEAPDAPCLEMPDSPHSVLPDPAVLPKDSSANGWLLPVGDAREVDPGLEKQEVDPGLEKQEVASNPKKLSFAELSQDVYHLIANVPGEAQVNFMQLYSFYAEDTPESYQGLSDLFAQLTDVLQGWAVMENGA